MFPIIELRVLRIMHKTQVDYMKITETCGTDFTIQMTSLVPQSQQMELCTVQLTAASEYKYI